MTVDRTQAGHQTSYTLHDPTGPSCTLTLGADHTTPAEWTIQLPATPAATHHHAPHRYAAPLAVRLRPWLAPIIGTDRATELAAAVGAQPPPPPPPWRPPTPPAAALTIPRQADRRA